MAPSPVLTSGFTSTSVASLSRYTSPSSTSTRATSARSASAKPAAATISAALAASSPAIGSTSTRASFSGCSSARVSMSMPPSTEHMAR